jgi:hypothetical protein
MIQNTRQHKRFRLDLMEITGKMILAHKVEIIDISLGGVALKTDRRLNVGTEYLVKLGYLGKSIDLKGLIVRCELSKIEEISAGEGVSIYAVGMMFKDVLSKTISDFINSIEQDKKEAVPVMVDRRLNVRFYITTPGAMTLSFPTQFKVKDISLGGMLIQTEQALGIESIIPMELSLQADKPVNFIGRVTSCHIMEDKGQAHYEIGVEFKDLTDKDRASLKAFMDFLAVIKVKTDVNKTEN